MPVQTIANAPGHVDWIGWFFSDSLLRLFVIRDAPSFWGSNISMKDGFPYNLFELAASKCHDLQQVEMPSCDPILSRRSGSADSRMTLVSQLSCLWTALRVVSGTESLLDPQNLEALGQLPRLDTLKINAQYGESSSIAAGEIKWPEQCFPSIRHLHLIAIRFDTLEALWNFTSLVHPLITLEVETGVQDRAAALCSSTRSRTVKFIRELSSRSPNIINLDCRLHACRFFCNACAPARLSSSELTCLEALPLQTLSFRRICLAENVYHSHLAGAIPQVRTLQLLDAHLTLEDLYHYVTCLPRLEYIGCTLADPRLEMKGALIEHSTVESALRAHHAINFDLKLPQPASPESPLHDDQISFLARYLRQLCPLARCSSIDGEFEHVCRKINKILLKHR
ncbi:hypothetical protein B0J17DRAFT_75680 [Rhizoctonia solani]|nr:hypothetical protein B0J17DRAFT_75680 [Rhizoctonia solani]